MEQTALKIQNLGIGYTSRVVAQHINFTLIPGELCAIVGVNGIGKSTLLRSIAGLQPHLKGTVEIRQKPFEKQAVSERAKEIALVLTEPPATRNLTVRELITLGRQPHTNWWGTLTKADTTKIRESMALFSLEELASRKCFELSDGQLQRVLIARAMAQDTPIILLDEPTTHLDLSHKVEIFKRLQQLAHVHHKTILFTTHEIDLAIQLCDKMLILDGKENPFAAPCELIEKGCFESLFPSELVTFDAATGSFKLKK